MAETTGQQNTERLVRLLKPAGIPPSFYQALLVLERLSDGVPIGADGPAHQERLRIRPSVALSCPAADIESIAAQGNERVQVTATFLGLYGVDSPLPNIFAERLALTYDEPSGRRVRHFLDLFHHRLYSLLFRVWKKARPVSSGGGQLDPLYDRLLALIGYSGQLGLGGQRRPHLSEVRMRVLRPRTAQGLETLLRYRLGYRCAVDQLEQRLVAVPADQRCRLGQQGCLLGSLVVGARVTDCNKIVLQVATESFPRFEDLVPEGADRQQIDAVMRGYLRDPLAYDIAVTLPTEQVPPWLLGQGGKLGRSLWLGPPRPYAHWRWRCKPLA